MFDNALSPGELERLAFLAEQCAEVIQAVGKIVRRAEREPPCRMP